MNTRLLFAPVLCAAVLVAACSSKQIVEPPVDSDRDGVYDPYDQCPTTVSGVDVTSDGCPGDTDGDGVPDYLDECPDTEPGAAACRYGCELADPIVINLVSDEFDFDKATLKPDMKVALDGLIKLLSSEGDIVDLTVVGHTDSTGTDEYNLDLSDRRAQAVVDYLKANGLANVEFEQIGKGESEPVEGNDTAEGRAKNRRVEIYSHSSDQH